MSLERVRLRPNIIPSLDGLRAVAIVLVIYGHANLPSILKGSVGVTVFFFLSGYLITHLMRAEADKRGRISIHDFYLRRVFRILPPLYIVLGLAIALTLAGVLVSSMTGFGVLATSTFWANYYIIFEGRDGLPGAMNALWSLAVEEHYYIVFPLIYVAMRKWLPRRQHQTLILVAVCLAIMAWRIVLAQNGASWDRLYLATDTRADAILWGSVLAIACNPMKGDVRAPRQAWLLTPVLIVGGLVFAAVSHSPEWFEMTVGYTIQSIALFGVFIPLILVPESFFGKIMNWTPVAWIGVVSYSLYLIHRPTLVIVEGYLDLPQVVEVFIAVAISCGLAQLMKMFVEDPIRVWRQKPRHSGGPKVEP